MEFKNIISGLKSQGLNTTASKIETIVSSDEGKAFDFTVSVLQAKYRKFNKKYFDNELPTVPIRKIKSAKIAGKVKAKPHGEEPGEILFLGVSDVFKFSEDEIDSTMLHEMIHVYFFNKGGKFFKENHGPNFRKMAKDLSKRSGLSINIMSDAPDFGVRENRLLTVIGLVWKEGLDSGEKDGYAFVSLPFFKRKFKNFMNASTKLTSKLGGTITVYVTDSVYTRRAKVFKSFTGFNFFTRQIIVDDIIKTGKPALLVDKESKLNQLKLPSWV